MRKIALVFSFLCLASASNSVRADEDRRVVVVENVAAQQPGSCNQYGCYENGGGCNYFGCWNMPIGSCNEYGCSESGACTYFGCP